MTNPKDVNLQPFLVNFYSPQVGYTTNTIPGMYEIISRPTTPSLYDLPLILSSLNSSWETREDAINQIAQCLGYLTLTDRTDNLFQEVASAIFSFLQKEIEPRERPAETSKVKETPNELPKSRTLDFTGFENSESAPP